MTLKQHLNFTKKMETTPKTRIKPTNIGAPSKNKNNKRKRSGSPIQGPEFNTPLCGGPNGSPPSSPTTQKRPNKKRRSTRIKERKQNSRNEFIPKQNIETIPELIDNARKWKSWYDTRRTEQLTFEEIEYTKILDIIPYLEELESMIGMTELKKAIVQQLKFFVQGMYKNNMMNLILTGAPGTGKTTVGKILANIYYHIGVLHSPEDDEYIDDNESDNESDEEENESDEDSAYSNEDDSDNDSDNDEDNDEDSDNSEYEYIEETSEPFRVASRSDLIAGYLGQTAIKTRKFLKSCLGSVVFIDEAYSLGSDNDSFSTECIDEINRFLSEHAGQIICILAGYEKDLNERFFSKNEGLKRRFNWKFHMPKYTPEQLKDIFIFRMKKEEWEYRVNAIDVDPFKINITLFTENGGDCEELFNLVKIKHSDRIFGLTETEKKKQRFIINHEDFKKGFDHFIQKKKILNGNTNTFNFMYL